ncbi:cytidylyltransferase domain-containing protein [Legionella sp. km772]|uniref:acylneuraminate cytidylyltransferase family protein n=1 Tax=Legionella sp. km772 TaxID=2498111 RepID=UPI000F8F795D|nr:acylneuraminate cytidylyltransferase family protein [Legionella sp. km772]RUR12113.1 acylneuraminate cytidylyltransferase family protein [Legionella sp. km772]
MKIYPFIFARGGSKGLPKKNIKLLAGKPLIQYSIEMAQKINPLCFVSTDDEEIAEIAANLGAVIIPRPPELATDTCSEWLAWRHAIEFVQAHYGSFDLFISLPPTSPLRAMEDLTAAINSFTNNDADICISTTKASRSPFFNMIKKNPDGYCELVNSLNKTISRRQDAPEVFDITTVSYVTKPEFVLTHTNLFEGKVVSVDIPKERAVDIDDIYDFIFAETLIKSRDVNNAE